MRALPAGVADSLHILEPEPSPWPKVAMIAALLLLLLFLLLRRRRPRPAPAPVLKSVPAVQAPVDSHFVDEIRLRFTRSGELRKGCHALAEGLRLHLDRVLGGRFSTMTVSEVEERLGQGATAAVLDLLGQLQFQQREPEQDEFQEVCKMTRSAAEAVESGP